MTPWPGTAGPAMCGSPATAAAPKDRFAPPPTANPPSTTCAPSLQAVDETLAAHTTLRVTRQRELRPHYARTLRLWRERFCANWPQIHALGFDETFRRMWEFYLAYAEAGFRAGYLGVSQLQLTRTPA